MQFISHFLGGALANINNHVGVMHEIFHNGERVGLVNSFHSNEIINLPKELQITSQTSDGCIESFVHINRPWIGWMWHPERMEHPEWMKQKLKSILNP
jgi:putative glutamine amidotransferase